jgi:hypothetical protein
MEPEPLSIQQTSCLEYRHSEVVDCVVPNFRLSDSGALHEESPIKVKPSTLQRYPF